MRCAVAPCIRGDHGEAGEHIDARGRKWSAARVAGMRAQSPEDADAQKQWQDHLRSCAVCYRAADYGGLCNRGQAIWTVVAGGPPPTLTADDWAKRVAESHGSDVVLVVALTDGDDGASFRVTVGAAVRGAKGDDPTDVICALLDLAKADVREQQQRERAAVPMRRGDA